MRFVPERICRLATLPLVALGPTCSVTLGLGGPPLRAQFAITEVAVSVGAAEESSYGPKAAPGTLENLQTATCASASPGARKRSRARTSLVTRADRRQHDEHFLRFRHDQREEALASVPGQARLVAARHEVFD